MSQENKQRYQGCDDPREVSDLLFSKKGKIFVDIGACDGFYTFRMAEKFEKVYAFEPFPAMAKYLRKIAEERKLKGIEVREYALGDEEGVKTFYISPRGPRCHSLLPVGAIKTTVPVTTLNKEFPNIQIDLIKVDVEGAEFQVMLGAREIMGNVKEWVIEVHNLENILRGYGEADKKHSERKEIMEKILHTFGYETEWITHLTVHAWRKKE